MSEMLPEEHKQAEEQLLESEERFRKLSEAAFEALAVHEQGKILFVNQAFVDMFRYELSDLPGKSVLELAAPESRELVMKNVQAGYEQPYEAVGLRKDGSTFTAELRSRNTTYQGRPVRITALRDVSARKKIEEMKETLMRNVTHKMKTPLAMMEMAINMRDRAAAKNDRQLIEKAIKILRDNLSLAIAYVNNIVSLFLLKREEMPATETEGYPYEILSEVLKDMVPIITQKGLWIDLNVDPKLGVLAGEKNEYKTLFHNLIDNAIKFTVAGGIGITTATRPDNRIEVTIKDTGHGIQSDKIKNVFEPFFMTSTVMPGIGLGLTICREIAARYGGEIKIESGGAGKGTTVSLILPSGEK